MHARRFSLFIALLLATGVSCVPVSEDIAASGNDEEPHCPGQCPGDMVPVDRCPTFPTQCEEVPDCDDTLICAHPDDVAPNQQNNGAGELDCDEPVYCPPGTEEVSSCPTGELCTHINLCDEQLICREDPQLCAEQPLCPDGDRAVDDCVHDHCYVHHHCSGPVDCLPCTDELPDRCPEGHIDVDAGYCDEIEVFDGEARGLFGGLDDGDPNGDDNDGEDNDGNEDEKPEEPNEPNGEEGDAPIDDENDDDGDNGDETPNGEDGDDPVICRRVETCEATLLCASPSVCIEDAACQAATEQVEACDEAQRDCYTLPACEGPMACEAKDYDEGCEATPECPDYYHEVGLDECVEVIGECVMKVACGEILGCLPAEG